MKKLIVLLILIPSVCFGGVSLSGVSAEKVIIEYVTRLFTMGDSITVGIGDDFTYNGTNYVDIGGYRVGLQNLGVVYDFVGLYGNTDPLGSDFQPRHFGQSYATIEIVSSNFTSLDQLGDWYHDGEVITIIHLGTNNAANQFETPDPCDPLPCTSTRVADTSNISSYVDNLIALVNKIDTDNPDNPVIVCLIVPRKEDPISADYDQVAYLDEWVQAFNTELETDLITRQGTKSNLYYVDMYNPMVNDGDNPEFWYDGTFSDNDDRSHPNNAGYRLMSSILRAKMIEKNLID